jgi:hypothetical protein
MEPPLLSRRRRRNEVALGLSLGLDLRLGGVALVNDVGRAASLVLAPLLVSQETPILPFGVAHAAFTSSLEA